MTEVLRPLRDYIPLKQGLRPGLERGDLRSYIPQRLYSTKTRIKTRIADAFLYSCEPQRLYSTKTRIKTRTRMPGNKVRHLRDYIPLKQGLRHATSSRL